MANSIIMCRRAPLCIYCIHFDRASYPFRLALSRYPTRPTQGFVQDCLLKLYSFIVGILFLQHSRAISVVLHMAHCVSYDSGWLAIYSTG